MRSVFIDLPKAFDTVNRESPWTVRGQYGFPGKLVDIIKLFHDGMKGQVFSKRHASAPFVTGNVVKQGCVLAPVLFVLHLRVLTRCPGSGRGSVQQIQP